MNYLLAEIFWVGFEGSAIDQESPAIPSEFMNENTILYYVFDYFDLAGFEKYKPRYITETEALTFAEGITQDCYLDSDLKIKSSFPINKP
jgi:hypothetical protein